MDDLEYLAALQDVLTRRREAIRLLHDLSEEVWRSWLINKRPLGMMEILNLSNVKTICELMAQHQSVPDASTSSSPTSPTVGGAGNVTPLRAGPHSIPLQEIPSQTRLITSAEP